jgi:hypothetical protein
MKKKKRDAAKENHVHPFPLDKESKEQSTYDDLKNILPLYSDVLRFRPHEEIEAEESSEQPEEPKDKDTYYDEPPITYPGIYLGPAPTPELKPEPELPKEGPLIPTETGQKGQEK